MTFEQFRAVHSRRTFLRDTVGGLGTIALANLFAGDGLAATDPLGPKTPHFASKAKNVIFLFMEGAPSQIDLFDPKPKLKEWHGKPLPPEMTKDLKLAFTRPTAAVLAIPRVFQKHGQTGMENSDWVPPPQQDADH